MCISGDYVHHLLCVLLVPGLMKLSNADPSPDRSHAAAEELLLLPMLFTLGDDDPCVDEAKAEVFRDAVGPNTLCSCSVLASAAANAAAVSLAL